MALICPVNSLVAAAVSLANSITAFPPGMSPAIPSLIFCLSHAHSSLIFSPTTPAISDINELFGFGIDSFPPLEPSNNPMNPEIPSIITPPSTPVTKLLNANPKLENPPDKSPDLNASHDIMNLLTELSIGIYIRLLHIHVPTEEAISFNMVILDFLGLPSP